MSDGPLAVPLWRRVATPRSLFARFTACLALSAAFGLGAAPFSSVFAQEEAPGAPLEAKIQAPDAVPAQPVAPAAPPEKQAPVEDVADEPAPAAMEPATALQPVGPPDLAAVMADPGLDARSRMELDVLSRVNAIRAQHGLHPLTLDNRLVAAARQHAVDMAHGRFCRHNGRDGSAARDRMRRNGYPYNNWAGENIICSRQSAESMVGWWLNSPPHRRNILHGHFQHIGVGVSMHGQWGANGVLVFADGAESEVEADVFRAFREGKVGDWVAATGE